MSRSTTLGVIEKEIRQWLSEMRKGGVWEWDAVRKGISDRDLMFGIYRTKQEKQYETRGLTITLRPDIVIALRSTGEVIAKNATAIAMIRRILKLPYPRKRQGARV